MCFVQQAVFKSQQHVLVRIQAEESKQDAEGSGRNNPQEKIGDVGYVGEDKTTKRHCCFLQIPK